MRSNFISLSPCHENGCVSYLKNCEDRAALSKLKFNGGFPAGVGAKGAFALLPYSMVVGNEPKSDKGFDLHVRDAHLRAKADVLCRRADEDLIDAVIGSPAVLRR